MRFDLSDPTFQGILIAFIGGLLVVLFVFLVRLLRKSGSEIFSRLKRGKREKTGLENYRKTLEDKTLLWERSTDYCNGVSCWKQIAMADRV
jgi:hypothetical protein